MKTEQNEVQYFYWQLSASNCPLGNKKYVTQAETGSFSDLYFPVSSNGVPVQS